MDTGKTRGFTLLEVLIAISIFSLIGFGSFVLLQSMVNAKSISAARNKELADIQIFFSLLSHDLTQADALSLGSPDKNPVATTDSFPLSEGMLRITKVREDNGSSNNNAAGLGVIYSAGTIADQDNLKALSRQTISLPANVPFKMTFANSLSGLDKGLKNVKLFGAFTTKLTIRALTANGEWVGAWPVANETGAFNAIRVSTAISGASGIPSFSMPQALEVTVENSLLGEMRRYFELPRGFPVIPVQKNHG